MTVSVIIPTTLQRASVVDSVKQAIASAAKTGPDAEVIVIANGPDAIHRSLPLRSPHLRVVNVERPSAPGARNEGIHVARHETICFADDDCQVPEEWCTAFQAALAGGRYVAAAAPVRITVHGPVTAFINHQRILDAPPDDAGELKYLVTANCAFRRDLAPAGHRFDDHNFEHSAEDADFGYRLRDAGGTIAWLGDTEPVIHRLDESIQEITERFVRYGRGNAKLYWRKGRWRESVPDPTEWYRALCLGTSTDIRQFSEIGVDAVRAAFACYDKIQSAAFLIGYLDMLGTDLGEQIIRIDAEALEVGWTRLGGRIRQLTAGHEEALGSPLELFRANYSNDDVSPLIEDFFALLSDVLSNAAPFCEVITSSARASLNKDADRFRAEQQRTHYAFRAVVRETLLQPEGLADHTVEQMGRRTGLPFSEACHEAEKLFWRR